MSATSVSCDVIAAMMGNKIYFHAKLGLPVVSALQHGRRKTPLARYQNLVNLWEFKDQHHNIKLLEFPPELMECLIYQCVFMAMKLQSRMNTFHFFAVRNPSKARALIGC